MRRPIVFRGRRWENGSRLQLRLYCRAGGRRRLLASTSRIPEIAFHNALCDGRSGQTDLSGRSQGHPSLGNGFTDYGFKRQAAAGRKCRITPSRFSGSRSTARRRLCHELDDVGPVVLRTVDSHPKPLRTRRLSSITREPCRNVKTRRSRRSVMPYPSPRGRAGRRRTALARLGGGE